MKVALLLAVAVVIFSSLPFFAPMKAASKQECAFGAGARGTGGDRVCGSPLRGTVGAATSATGNVASGRESGMQIVAGVAPADKP
jgi:hypothetical protein